MRSSGRWKVTNAGSLTDILLGKIRLWADTGDGVVPHAPPIPSGWSTLNSICFWSGDGLGRGISRHVSGVRANMTDPRIGQERTRCVGVVRFRPGASCDEKMLPSFERPAEKIPVVKRLTDVFSSRRRTGIRHVSLARETSRQPPRGMFFGEPTRDVGRRSWLGCGRVLGQPSIGFCLASVSEFHLLATGRADILPGARRVGDHRTKSRGGAAPHACTAQKIVLTETQKHPHPNTKNSHSPQKNNRTHRTKKQLLSSSPRSTSSSPNSSPTSPSPCRATREKSASRFEIQATTPKTKGA